MCSSDLLLPYILVSLADALNMPPDALAAVLTQNTRNFFSLPETLYDGTFDTSSLPPVTQPLITPAVDIIGDVNKQHSTLTIKNISLPTLKPGQAYFAHNGTSYIVSLQTKALLTKQKSLLPPEAFDQLALDILSMSSA